MHMEVYLPPGYQTSEKPYPVVYALGGTVSYTIDRMVRNGEIAEIIAVGVERHAAGWYTEGAETYVTSEVVGHTDAHYRTVPHRNGRGIVGHSIGGGGAMHLALSFSDVFACVVASSAPSYGRSLEALDLYLKQPALRGSRGPGLSHDLGGDALGDLRQTAAVHHERGDGVALNVDEAGTDDAVGISGDDHGRLTRRDLAGRGDGGDVIAADGDIVGKEPVATLQPGATGAGSYSQEDDRGRGGPG